jgi:hypothetical protein
MEPKKKKTQADWPIFGFRISAVDKSELQMRVDKLITKMNSMLDPKQRAHRKNEVIIEALKIGLASLENEAKKK